MRDPRRRVATSKADEAVPPSVTTGTEALLRRGAPPSQDSCACRRSRRRCTTGTPAPPGALDATARARLLSAPAAAPAYYLGAGSTRAPPAGLRQPCYYTRGARRPAPLTSGPCSGGTRLTCGARCRASHTTSPPRGAATRLPRARPARPTRVARHAGSGGSGPTSGCLGAALTSRREAQTKTAAHTQRREPSVVARLEREAPAAASQQARPTKPTNHRVRQGREPCSDAGCHPRRTRAPADAAGAVALREPLLRQGRSMPLRALAYFRHRQQHPPATSGPARHAHATCRAATTVLLHPRRPAARAAYLQSMQWRH